jgi:hypothetical protein
VRVDTATSIFIEKRHLQGEQSPHEHHTSTPAVLSTSHAVQANATTHQHIDLLIANYFGRNSFELLRGRKIATGPK